MMILNYQTHYQVLRKKIAQSPNEIENLDIVTRKYWIWVKIFNVNKRH